MERPLRIGILGAARIAPPALVLPAQKVEGVEVAAVAARDPARAQAFAREHAIPQVHRSYEELVAAPELDAVYNPLPNALHCEWTLQALRAGKHVLCEKPFASNAAEARRMERAAQDAGLVLVEAFHWRYHPLAERVLAIWRGGELGRVDRIEAHFTVPQIPPTDIRYDLALAGGALMDLGCYPISMLRHVTGEEPEVVSATARVGPPALDVAMEAELRFPSGIRGRIACSMEPDTKLSIELSARGERGRLRVANPLAPHFGNRIELSVGAGARSETVAGDPTYVYQLRAFVDAVRKGTPVPTGAADAVRNMSVIDAVYRAAGLPLRGAA